MIRDITLGQYYSGSSIIHRLDPRVKLTGTLIYMLSLFIFNNIYCYIAAFIFLVAVIIMTKVPIDFMLKGMKGIFLHILCELLPFADFVLFFLFAFFFVLH